MKKVFKATVICIFLCILCALFLIAGCSLGAREGLPKIKFITYCADKDGNREAHDTVVDLKQGKFEISKEVMFTLPKDADWFGEMYPVSILENLVVLRKQPVYSDKDYHIIKENELWYKDYVLEYNPKTSSAVIKQSGKCMGEIKSLMYDGMSIKPMAFFIDENRNAVIIGQRYCEGADFDEIYTVILTASELNDDGRELVVENKREYNDMFGEKLNKLMMPASYIFSTNLYIDEERQRFIWNESQSVVAIDAYTGEYEILLDCEKIKKDMPFIDFTRESYECFGAFACCGELSLVVFPNYNNVLGRIIAIYDKNMNFMGSILCTEGCISYSDEQNEEVCRYEDSRIMPLLSLY